MRVLFFWEPVGGMTLQHRCNPYAPLLGAADKAVYVVRCKSSYRQLPRSAG